MCQDGTNEVPCCVFDEDDGGNDKKAGFGDYWWILVIPIVIVLGFLIWRIMGRKGTDDEDQKGLPGFDYGLEDEGEIEADQEPAGPKSVTTQGSKANEEVDEGDLDAAFENEEFALALFALAKSNSSLTNSTSLRPGSRLITARGRAPTGVPAPLLHIALSLMLLQTQGTRPTTASQGSCVENPSCLAPEDTYTCSVTSRDDFRGCATAPHPSLAGIRTLSDV